MCLQRFLKVEVPTLNLEERQNASIQSTYKHVIFLTVLLLNQVET